MESLRQEDWKSGKRFGPYFLVVAVYLFAGSRLFLLIWRYSVNVLLWDQWDIDDATLFQQHSVWKMFRWQYGPHRQGLGALLQKLIDPRIHWNSRYEAFAIGAILFVAAVLALLLKMRLVGGIRYADIFIPLLFLTPLQYERLIAAINPTQGPLPLVLALGYCFCWLIRSAPAKYICLLLVNFLLIYTGYGMFFGFITPGLLALDYYVHIGQPGGRQPGPRGRLWSAAALAISLVSLASFFVDYKFQPAVHCFSPAPKNPADYLRYIGMMFAHVGGFRISNLHLAALAGALALLCFGIGISAAVRRSWGSELRPRDAAIVALLTYSAIFCLSATYGRVCLGLHDATSSRHTEWLMLGFFGLYLSAWSASNRAWRIFLVLALVVLSLHGAKRMNHIDAGELIAISDGKRAWSECYLKRHGIQECDTVTGFRIYYPEPGAGEPQEKVDFLERNHLNLFDGSK